MCSPILKMYYFLTIIFLQGNATALCVNGQWSSGPPICRGIGLNSLMSSEMNYYFLIVNLILKSHPVTFCPDWKKPENSIVLLNSKKTEDEMFSYQQQHDDKLTFSCLPGYSLIGKSYSYVSFLTSSSNLLSILMTISLIDYININFIFSVVYIVGNASVECSNKEWSSYPPMCEGIGKKM